MQSNHWNQLPQICEIVKCYQILIGYMWAMQNLMMVQDLIHQIWMEATNYMLMHLVEKCFPIVKDGNVMKLVDQKKKNDINTNELGKKK